MKKGFTLIELMVFIVMAVFIVPAFIGWGMNIYKFTQCDFKEPYKAELIRAIAIPVVPMGAVVGYIKIKDVYD